MSDWLVTLHYEPTPSVYAVLDAPNRYEARDTVLLHKGYHGGMDITIKEWDGKELPPNTVVRCLSWRGTPLTAEEREMVRFND